MDSAYNRDAAVATLVKITEERSNSPHSSLQLRNMFENKPSLTLRAMQIGVLWRLASLDKNGEVEEVVASFQGIICKKDLPPFTEKIGKQIKFLRQGVSLTALGNPVLEKTIASIAEIHAIFMRAIGDHLQECTASTKLDDFAAVEMSNRYFTPRREVVPAEICEINPDIDPLGILSRLASSAYVHTEENKVHYYEKVDAPGDEAYMFRPASPAVFQVGDIVEAQVSFIVVPLRDNKYKMSTILRSISLLEKKFTQDAAVRRATKLTEKPKIVLKRKVGYHAEEVSVTRKRMDIDENNGENGENLSTDAAVEK